MGTPEHTAALSRAFDEASSSYDLLVRLSPGYHAQLRSSAEALAQSLAEPSRAGEAARVVRLLDVGCGSGASTQALLHAANARLAGARGTRLEVAGVDASAGMLSVARRKSWPDGVRFREGRAQDIERIVEDLWPGQQLDGVFAAYLVRNVPADERDGVLAGIARVLRPGAPLVLHEYSLRGEGRRPRLVWDAVCRGVIVPLAWTVSRQTDIYEYLWRSVREFDDIDSLMRRMVHAGYDDVRARTFGGWQRDITHTVHGRSPR